MPGEAAPATVRHMSTATAPAERWAHELQGWAIPEDILERAPESPWSFDPSQFRARVETARHADTPSRRAALEALPPGGSVLDIGAGAGAASLPLAPPARSVTAVDSNRSMLEAFAAETGRAAVGHAEIEGTWPEVSGRAPVADVVVCHHVVYNVAALPPFLEALGSHARRRVVVELTTSHPMTSLGPLWERFHALTRPRGPGLEDFLTVADWLGIPYHCQTWDPPTGDPPDRAHVIRTVRKRLCLTADRDPDIDAALPPGFSMHAGFAPGGAGFATVWWPGTA